MQIIVDTKHDDAATMRLAASLLLTLSGDISEEETAAPAPTNTKARDTAPTPPPPAPSNVLPFTPPPPPPLPAETTTSTASSAGSIPPPPAPVATAATSAQIPPPPAANAAAASGAASVEYDTAGMPWDARIHQKAKGKKKDGTWKLIKGIDTNIVQAVVKELQAAKLAGAGVPGAATPDVPAGTTAPVAPPVTLPASGVPVPPPPPAATVAQGVPVPPVPAPVPVPSGAAPGGVPSASGAVTFRQVVDKITAATKDGKLTAQKVTEIVQGCGAPNLMALATMADLIPEVNSRVDAAIAGLL